MAAIFGNATKGMRLASLGAVKFERDDPLYVSTLRTTRCDASGRFSFPNVPDGVWYVTSSVKWQGGEGGSMMQRVDVQGGLLVEVFLGTGPTLQPELAEIPNVASASPQRSAPGSLIQMKKQGGTYVVPVLINNAITLDFTVDSGAADVTIPEDVVSTLIRTGTIKATDLIGEQTYVLADGSKVKSKTFRIRSLRVGDRVLENVTGSVAGRNGSLLLGQSFLGRFKFWSIDNSRHALVLE
jgi:clan AA aspartic protease (TIGR02281 family)